MIIKMLLVFMSISPNYQEVEYVDDNGDVTESYINIIDEDTYKGKDFYFDVDPGYFNKDKELEETFSCWNSATGEEYEVTKVKESSTSLTYSCKGVELKTDIFRFASSKWYIFYSYVRTVAINNAGKIFIYSFSAFLIFILLYSYFAKKIVNMLKRAQQLISFE